ncbi:MAG: ATP-binding protein [bacterium]|nr:ATP-binding protein [bacterium]
MNGLRARMALPGTHSSCALLTLLTILLAWPSPPEALRALVLPCYFGLLFWFFSSAARGNTVLRGQPMRLICGGFLVLTTSFLMAAIVHLCELEQSHGVFVYLRAVCERGALFLLGLTLIAYGMMLWIPDLLRAHDVLQRDLAEQKTERLVAENAKFELEHRLVEADRRAMLGGLAASIAHDLRNPLSIVVGTAESLCRKARTPAEITEHTDVIRRNIDRANHTLSSLIDLGRPHPSESKTFAAREVVDEVLALVTTEARRQGIAFAVTVDGSTSDPLVHADRTLLAQALLNLALNAVQAATGAGEVHVRVRQVERADAAAAVVIAVEDRGPGIPAPVRMPQFVPFHTTKADGTGLGLWSCRRIAAELAGRLALYPRHRGGARAALLLPAGAAPATQPPATNESPECLIAAS